MSANNETFKPFAAIASAVSRREFVAGSAGALALASTAGAKDRGRKHRKHLFLNLSHITGSMPHRLFIGGKSYELRDARNGHPVLSAAKASNSFLRQLPSGAVTHVAENVLVAADSVSTGYTVTPTSGGQWEMPTFFINIPAQGFQQAYGAITEGAEPGQPLPHSAKRMKYGLPPAMSLQELMDEQELLDTTNMASAIVNMHPELLSVVPSSAALIQTKFISQRSVFALTRYLDTAGPAQPEQSVGQPNSSGWATLSPYTDNSGAPLVNQKGAHKGLIQYDPQWSPTTKTLAAAAMSSALRGAKNYVPATQSASSVNLGVDATPGRSNIPDSAVLGTIWTRRDGETSIVQTSNLGKSLGSGSVNYTLTNDTLNHNGYSASLDSDNTTAISLTLTNTYLRYLGVWAQFYDAKGDLVPTSKLPSGIGNPTISTKDVSFLGFIAPEFTIYGVPLESSSLNPKFNFPVDVASSAAILASGLGVGSHTFAETETVGIVLTSLFNLIVPAALMALGVATQLDLFVKTVVIPFLKLYVAEFIVELLPQGTEPSQAAIARTFWRGFAKAEFGPFLGIYVTQYFIPFLARAEVIEAAEDAIPIAGVILQAIGVLGTIAEIDETTIEVLSSPWTYQYTLTGTHDLPVTIYPDPKHKQFPSAAASCQISAIFDGGVPQLLTLPVSSSPGPSISGTFQAVALGGNVTVHVAFYTADGTQVGHGSVGPLVNDASAAPSITITEDLLPINASTVYQHKQKTTLDANGNHQWTCGPAPTIVSPVGFCENAPGNLCALRGITVSSASNNIGYGWQSFSTASCSSGGQGQLDQVANIPSANGTGGNAQNGYALIPCSLIPGTQLVYDPSQHATSNFYLDTTSNIVRQINLNPPAFADPRQNAAWGQLNLSSNDLLLHPAGTIISINATAHKLESLKIPAGPTNDANVGVKLLASVYSGLGTRPGLMDTPTVATVTADGVVLVLEAGNNRIHAMDIYGNPVRYFTKQPTQYFLNFSATGGQSTQYLDIAAEFTGFIYVLSSSTQDGASYQYRLDIYAFDQTGTNPVCTTQNFNAAKVTVDYWRNVYSLNYEVLKLPNGSFPATGVTEPSVSQWLPTAPPPCEVVGRPPEPRRKHERASAPVQRLLRRRDLWRA